MDIMDAISLRRSVRKYTKEPVSDQDLTTILEAAMAAPSGLNLQPWYFVAVKSEEKKQKVYDIMEQVSVKISSELDVRFAKHPQVAAETKQFIRTCGKAPVVLLVFLRGDDYEDMDTALQGVAAAIQNACLAARALDIGSCWMTAAPQVGFSDAFREAFAPEMGRLVATITLGHTDKWPKQVRHKDGRYDIV